MRFLFFFLHFLVCTGLGSGLDFFSFVLFSFVSSVLTCFNFVATLSLGFVGLFFSEIILDICELILSLLGICVAMQCNDAINCVLASPSLLPFWGNQVQGNSILKKKLCKRDDSRGKVLLWLSWVELYFWINFGGNAVIKMRGFNRFCRIHVMI